MKLESRSLAGFLRDPGRCRAVLFHGDDQGAIRDHASSLTRTVAGDLSDAFRVVDVGREAYSSLATELASEPLTGGRRVVRLRDGSDSAADPIAAALAGPGRGLLIVEATVLPSRSRLRALFERSEDAVAIACYPATGRGLAAEIQAELHRLGVAADAPAIDLLERLLGSDRGITQRELEKLALFAGSGGRVDAEAVTLLTGDFAGSSIDDAVDAALTGSLADATRALDLALEEGGTSVGALRAMGSYVHRLLSMRQEVDQGAAITTAVRGARPPLFFRRQSAAETALRLWTVDALSSLGRRIRVAERQSKTTGLPADTLTRHLFATVAARARASARR